MNKQGGRVRRAPPRAGCETGSDLVENWYFYLKMLFLSPFLLMKQGENLHGFDFSPRFSNVLYVHFLVGSA